MPRKSDPECCLSGKEESFVYRASLSAVERENVRYLSFGGAQSTESDSKCDDEEESGAAGGVIIYFVSRGSVRIECGDVLRSDKRLLGRRK